jgi:hypothetical protein
LYNIASCLVAIKPAAGVRVTLFVYMHLINLDDESPPRSLRRKSKQGAQKRDAYFWSHECGHPMIILVNFDPSTQRDFVLTRPVTGYRVKVKVL